MIRLSDEQSVTAADALPAATLAFLRDPGVPERLEFRLIEYVFTFDLEPLLAGGFFRIGWVDRGWYAMALQRTTGRFGYVFAEPGQPPWVFSNSSVQCFLSCVAAAERLWQLVETNWIASASCGGWLEREIRQFDPVVFADENNIWSFLVEELKNGVV